MNSLKKTLLASLGVIAFTHDKLRKVIDELVVRGELTREQGTTLFETLVSRGEEEREEITSRLGGGLADENGSLRDILPTTRAEFQKLVVRVERIEARIGLDAVVTSSGAEPSAAAEPPSAALPSEEPGEALPPRDFDS